MNMATDKFARRASFANSRANKLVKAAHANVSANVVCSEVQLIAGIKYQIHNFRTYHPMASLLQAPSLLKFKHFSSFGR